MVNPALAKKAASSSGSKPTSSIAKNKNTDFRRNLQKDAKSNLNNLERSQTSDDGDEEDENNESFYSGSKNNNSSSFSSKGQNGKKKSKLNAKNLAKFAPLLLPLLLIGGVFALIGGVGSLLPGALNAKLGIEIGDDVDYNAEAAALSTTVAVALETGSLPSPFVDRLANVGLEVGFLDKNNNFIAGLRPTSANSIALASSSTDTSSTNSSLVIKFKDQIITSATFADYLNTDVDFYSAFGDATYGHAAGCFDESAQNFYESINNSRNVFADYTVSGNNATDTESFREILSNYFKDKVNTETGSCEGSHGNCSNRGNNAQVQTNIEAYLNTVQEQAKDSEDTVTAANLAVLVNNAINANETYQSMQYFLLIQESISKMMAGESSSSPVNAAMTLLNTSAPDENGTPKSAMQSPALSAVMTNSYSGLATDSSKYSLDRVLNTASDTIAALYGNHVASTTPVSSSINTALDNSSVSQTTSDRSSFVKNYSYVVVSSAADTVNTVTSGVIAAITPSISQSILFKNASDLSGIDAGEFLVKGAAAFGTKKAQFASGNTIGSAATIAKNIDHSNHLSELAAAADRKKYSPFDISNEHTFLGSIFANLSSSLLTSSTFSDLTSSFSSLTSKSLLSSLPGASATGDIQTYYNTFGNCPTLDRIGVKGDVYCNPITVTDLDTLKTALNSSDFTSWLSEQLELDEDGKYVVKQNSELAKYLEYNNGRSSTFGTQDANIYKSLHESDGWLKKLWDKIIGLLKSLFSNDASDNESHYDESKKGYATGEIFAISSENSDWDTYKYAQAYIAYSRVLNQIDYFSTANTNTTSIAAYFTPGTGNNITGTYLANLVDSYRDETDSEYLARISGITETEASSVLGFFAYNSYLASIDYENRLAFGIKEKPSERIVIEKQREIKESTTFAIDLEKRKEYLIA